VNSVALAIVSVNATYSSPSVDYNLATIVKVSQVVILELEGWETVPLVFYNGKKDIIVFVCRRLVIRVKRSI
jgi:hypothetical protein